MLRFSVIIPCFHDEQHLVSLLKQLARLPHTPWEIIVVDAGNSVDCAQICSQNQVNRLATKPCRGEQLLAGAAAAQGDVLWFLHADAGLTADPLTAMSEAVTHGAVGGYFRFRFNERAWPALILEPAIALRCHWGVPYGDQGIFMQRCLYEQVGGHAPWPLFEEVPLVQAARRLGNFASLSETILVDSRRWQRDGWWRRTWYNRKLALSFMRGVTPQELAARYHSKVDS